MNLPDIGPGVAFGIGKTNFRVAQFEAVGDMSGEPLIVPTPSTPEEFFARTGRAILDAAHDGARWAVLGVPGPVDVRVSLQDTVSQRLQVTNIPALNRKGGFDPVAEMIAADSAFDELITSDKFAFLTVNDGNLAAQAGAKLFAKNEHNVVADIIDGSGTGGAVVEKDIDYIEENLFHPVVGDWEMGHFPESLDAPAVTPEETISGKAFAGKLDRPIRDLDPENPAFATIARGLANVAIIFGLTASPDLIVISGGIGIEAQDKYKRHLEKALDTFASSYNPMARLATKAELRFPDVSMADTYELHGAPGALRSHLVRRAVSQMKRHTPLTFATFSN